MSKNSNAKFTLEDILQKALGRLSQVRPQYPYPFVYLGGDPVETAYSATLPQWEQLQEMIGHGDGYLSARLVKEELGKRITSANQQVDRLESLREQTAVLIRCIRASIGEWGAETTVQASMGGAEEGIIHVDNKEFIWVRVPVKSADGASEKASKQHIYRFAVDHKLAKRWGLEPGDAIGGGLLGSLTWAQQLERHQKDLQNYADAAREWRHMRSLLVYRLGLVDEALRQFEVFGEVRDIDPKGDVHESWVPGDLEVETDRDYAQLGITLYDESDFPDLDFPAPKQLFNVIAEGYSGQTMKNGRKAVGNTAFYERFKKRGLYEEGISVSAMVKRMRAFLEHMNGAGDEG